MSGDINTQNAAFSGVKDTIYDSKVLQALLDVGVFPSSFRIIKGVVDFTDAANQPTGTGKVVIDTFDGAQVLLSTGNAVIYAAAYAPATSPLTSGGSPTFTIGLSSTSGGSVGTALFTAGTTLASINNGVSSLQYDGSSAGVANVTRAIQLVGANEWLSVDVATAALTGGKLYVILVIA
jgi:hypothetical protein